MMCLWWQSAVSVADLCCFSSLKLETYFKSKKVQREGGTGSYIQHDYGSISCATHSVDVSG